MGFGLIFVGYITLLFFKLPFAVVAMAFGAYGIYRGLCRLSIYGQRFKQAAVWAAVLGIYYAAYSALWIISSFGVMEGIFSNHIFKIADSVVYAAILLVFHLYLYGAFEDICRMCEYQKGIKKAYMSRVLMVMFFAFSAINLAMLCFNVQSNYLLLAEYICQLSWIIYTAAYIYGCYMRIATDELIAEEERKIAEYDARYGYKRGKTKKKQ